MTERSPDIPGAKLAPVEGLTCEYTDRTDPARLLVAGVVDISTVDQFGAALDRAGAHSREFVVDLRALTYLSAVGVRALWQRQADIAAIVVTPASVVHQILSICDIPTTSH